MTLLHESSGPSASLLLSKRRIDDFDQGHLTNPEFHIAPRRTTDSFLLEVQDSFLDPFHLDGILRISRQLKLQFRERLQTNPACMLPSFHHKLATGKERGRYVALDLGGSTFRVAIIELEGKDDGTAGPRSRILEMQAFRVGMEVKDLIGTAFFDWMAARIIETLNADGSVLTADRLNSLPLALTWSFPVEYFSPEALVTTWE